VSYVAINVQDKLGPLYATLLVGVRGVLQGSHPQVTTGIVVQHGFCGRYIILYKEFNY